MLPVFCFKKLRSLIIFVVIISSSCIKLSHQQQQQSEYPLDQFNYFELSEQNNENLQSNLRNQYWLNPGQELIFATTSKPLADSVVFVNNQPTPTSKTLADSMVFVNNQPTITSKPLADSVVLVNNQPAVATMVPFIPSATTPSPQFLDCLSKCPTTSEFNPICASNRQQYGNEQKFICAQQCGADIEIVRRGSCAGLFPVSRG